jgi:hypothetical protein
MAAAAAHLEEQGATARLAGALALVVAAVDCHHDGERRDRDGHARRDREREGARACHASSAGSPLLVRRLRTIKTIHPASRPAPAASASASGTSPLPSSAWPVRGAAGSSPSAPTVTGGKVCRRL